MQALRYIQAFTSGSTFNEYLDDIRTVSAVERQFGVLGEAARRITMNFSRLISILIGNALLAYAIFIVHRYDEVKQWTSARFLHQYIHQIYSPLFSEHQSLQTLASDVISYFLDLATQ